MDTSDSEVLSLKEDITTYEINQQNNQLSETYDEDNKHLDYSCNECYKISIMLVKHQIGLHRTDNEVHRRNILQTLIDIQNKMMFREVVQSDLQYLDYEILTNVESRNRMKTEFFVNDDTAEIGAQPSSSLLHTGQQESTADTLTGPNSMDHYSVFNKVMVFLDKVPKNKIEDDNVSSSSSVHAQDFETIYTQPAGKILTSHTKEAKLKRVYKCDICLREYLKKKPLRDHMYKQHVGNKPYKCLFGCEQHFLHSVSRRHHHRMHHSPSSLRTKPAAAAATSLAQCLLCDNCGRSYKSRSSLIKHLKTHRNATETAEQSIVKQTQGEINSLACSTCGRLCSTRKALLSHTRLHSSNRPVFKCDLCDRQYFEKRSLREHMTVHSRVKLFECTYGCGKAFAHKSSRRHHHKSYHQSTKIPIENGGDASECVLCDFCGHDFNSKKRLLIHLRIHNAERTLYKCTDCDKVFFKKQSLRDHTNTHTGEKPYKCLFGCGEGFANISLRRYHDRRFHKPKEEFRCELCSKILQHKNTYVAHMRTHNGNNLYECKLCNNTYRTKSSLNNHHKHKHSNERPFTCERCHMGFTSKFKLAKHLERKTICSINERLKRTSFLDKIKEDGLIYACDLCDKSYYLKKSLGKHRRLKHKDRKPFKCERCHMIFTVQHRLDCHLNRKKLCAIVEATQLEWAR